MAERHCTCRRCGVAFSFLVKPGRPRTLCDLCGAASRYVKKGPKPPRGCAVNGCVGKHKAHGLCLAHYKQARKVTPRKGSTKPCAQCGRNVDVTPPRLKAQRVFCSKQCKGAWHAAHRSEEARNRYKADERRRYAERRAARPQYTRVYACKVCGKYGPKLWCGEEHRKRYAADKERGRAERNYVAVEFKCRGCGEVFVAEYGDKRDVFCSRKCAARHYKRAVGTNHRKRARHYGGRYEPFNLLQMFDRDGWRCQLCGRSTPRRLRGSAAPNAPEVDHIIPLADGGNHTWLNCQCACRECNIKKGASARGQLLMF